MFSNIILESHSAVSKTGPVPPEVVYDPYDPEIDAAPHDGLEATKERNPALLQRAVRLLRVEPL